MNSILNVETKEGVKDVGYKMHSGITLWDSLVLGKTTTKN
jgi:hypothetical protein